MVTVTFHRYRMSRSVDPPLPYTLPPGFVWRPWSPELLTVHAETLYRSFVGELDCIVFPSLGDPDGCLRVMQDIASRRGFAPEATWLVVTADRGEPCGTIQGVQTDPHTGAIQNLGVVPEYRRRGLAKALLAQAIRGFRSRGVSEVYLEVTGENLPAVRLYEQLGFRKKLQLRSIRRDIDPR